MQGFMESCVAATLRVHTLAKELGVPSKAIIEKCHAEGVELKNHMAAISAGLAESIREWFSVAGDVTSVEVADHVDVERVRRTVRHGKKALEQVAPPAEQPVVESAAEAVAGPAPSVLVAPPSVAVEAVPAPVELVVRVPPEAPGVAAPTEAPPETERLVAQATGMEAPIAPPSAPELAVEAGAGAVLTAAEVAAPAAGAVPGIPVPPPEPVRPAGPQLVPKPAELRGPRLVRIEAPEPARILRSRPAPVLNRATPETATTTAATRRGRDKTKKQEEEGEAAKVRTRSPRRHGSVSDVDQRLREWRDQDLLERKERLASVTGHGLRDRRAAERRRQATVQTGATPTDHREALRLVTPIAMKDFCATVGTPFAVISKKLLEHTGRLWTINQALEAEQVELLALDLGVAVEIEEAKTAYEALEATFAQRERLDLQPRPPVVAMLGHVDHGKTSLLDAIRKTKVAAGEAGGITQHIGAYRIDRGDWHVTFVDTPGHEAFTAMRARGANLTDVVVLVVAADDGVMPQTIEAINHAKAAGVPMVVALNKIDLPGTDLNRIYAQLAEQGLIPAEWGGQTDVIKTSATTGQGVDELIAHLSTLSELMELRADPSVPVQAMVIESQMRAGRGVVAQVLVREGTLRSGQSIVCGPGAGRIRALRDDRGKLVKEATPGTPVEVSGLNELPAAGDRLYEVESLATAKEIAEEVRHQRREAALETGPAGRTLEALMLGAGEAEIPELNIIVRADVNGSVEVLKKALGDFPAEKVRLNILHAAVGMVSEADVQLAKASGALVIGFNVIAEEAARQLADQLGVEVRQYRVIYDVLDDLHKALAGLLEPERRAEPRGSAEVREIFNVSRVGVVAGCYVSDGVVSRHHRARLVRDGRIVLEDAPIVSLRRFKDDAREVRAGLECGIKLQGFDDIKPGDVIQAYELIEVAQKL
jgi:translation initiation factor IF-2